LDCENFQGEGLERVICTGVEIVDRQMK